MLLAISPMHVANTARQTRHLNAQTDNSGFCALALAIDCRAGHGERSPAQTKPSREAAVFAQELGDARFVESIKDD